SGITDIVRLWVSKRAWVVPVLHGADSSGAGNAGVRGVRRTTCLEWITNPDCIDTRSGRTGETVRADADGFACLSAEHKAARPATNDVVQRTATIGILATTAKRQLIIAVQSEALANIERGVAIVCT